MRRAAVLLLLLPLLLNCAVRAATSEARCAPQYAALQHAAPQHDAPQHDAPQHATPHRHRTRLARDTELAGDITLTESAPELQYTFIEQALRPGGAVSLRCAARGGPAARVRWLRDARPLDAHPRYSQAEERSLAGDTLAVLNISAVSAADGGLYTCRASNRLGSAEHSARLNVYGPPSIRALGPLRVVAGDNVTVYCPYAGYPISSISWWRRGGGAAVSSAGRVRARGAALLLEPALAQDAGAYTCAVTAPDPAVPAASRDLEIQVRNPPKISPFMFSSELTEGSSVQVLCGVSSGDKPMYFSWLKDGAPLPSNLQIEEKSLNEFSLLMFPELTARHSGDYTCRVSNHAATLNYTATLSVKVAPAWVTEPLDAAVLLASPLLLECAARGHPTPTVVWYRKIGPGDSLGPENDQWEQLETWSDSTDLSRRPLERSRNGVVGAPSTAGRAAVRAPGAAGRAVLGAPAAARRHQGLYRCTADNGVGPPLLKHVNVTVHEPARFEGPVHNMSSVRGRDATLSCRALGDAPLAVHWTHAATRLDLNSYRWTVSETRTSEGLQSTLRLRAVERGDAGEYRCHAHNRFGRSELLMYLQVDEPPEAPRGVRGAGVGSRWVRVAWRGATAAELRYTALLTALHSPHHSFNVTLEVLAEGAAEWGAGGGALRAHVERLRPATAYSLRLSAANRVGESPLSDPFTFTTLEEAPSASPQNVRVRPAGSDELHVSWSAPPQVSWNGEVLGYVVSWREMGVESNEAGDAGRATAAGWSSAELTLRGLRALARYELLVRAYNRAGAGPASPPLYATTPDGVPEEPPDAVSCETVSLTSALVRWSPPRTSLAHALRGYDVHYVPLDIDSSWGGADAEEVRTTSAGGGARETTLQRLRPATNYSVWVRARAAAPGPAALPVYCSTAPHAPAEVTTLRALPVAADTLRASWLAPPRSADVTYYTLYVRELGKSGGEVSQRVESGGRREVWREVRGLRAVPHEVWVRAEAAAGVGPVSRPVTATPASPHLSAVAARLSSFGGTVWAVRGARVMLPCAAVGTPPLRRHWTPPQPGHSITDVGDLLLHNVEPEWSGNYTCSVRNAAGGDAVTYMLRVVSPPAAPAAPRLRRAGARALHLAWRPVAAAASILGYTVQWSLSSGAATVHSAAVLGGEATLVLRGLACGATYRVTLRAHSRAGLSPHSPPLLARTLGDRAEAAPGAEFVWANSTALRLNLLAWRARCPVTAWSAALRRPPAVAWRELRTDRDCAEAGELQPGAWYEVRVTVRSQAGDTTALYRAPTLADTGEKIGEAAEIATEARVVGGADAETAGGTSGATESAAWPWAAAAGGVALVVAVGGACVAWSRRTRRAAPACEPHPHPLYTAEPGDRNGKAIAPPDGSPEISPYATFSMSGGAGALQLRTFGRAECAGVGAAPPPRDLRHHAATHLGYGISHESDSESSGSPCAACAAELYRLPSPAAPVARLADTLPAVESSEDTSYSAGDSRRMRPGVPHARPDVQQARPDVQHARLDARHARPARGKRRRDLPGPSLRYM